MALSASQREEVKARLRSLRNRNGVRTIDPVEPARTFEVAYYREIVRPVEQMADLVDSQLLPLLERREGEYAVENRGIQVVNQTVFQTVSAQIQAFDRYANSFGKFAVDTAQRFTRRNDDYHYRKFVSGINKQFGINIADQMTEFGVTPILRKTTKDNVDLIVDLPKKYYEQINDIVFQGLTSGDDFTSIRKQLENLEGINKRRAKLIAVDQTGKLIGKLNQRRQSNEGIDRYQWDANLDARTRKRHVENDGEVFEWSDTSPGKAFGRPGEEVRCRCLGRGVVDEGILANRPRAKSARIPSTKKVTTPTVRPTIPKTQISKSKELREKVVKAESKIVNNKRETAIVWDRDGNQLFRKKGGKDYVNFNPSEVDKMRDAVVTHNHPSGNSFSPEDMKIFTKAQMNEIRAAGSEYTFSLSGQIDPKRAEEIFEATKKLRKEVVDETYKFLNAKSAAGEAVNYGVDGPRHDKEIYHPRLEELANRFGLKYKREKTNA